MNTIGEVMIEQKGNTTHITFGRGSVHMGTATRPDGRPVLILDLVGTGAIGRAADVNRELPPEMQPGADIDLNDASAPRVVISTENTQGLEQLIAMLEDLVQRYQK
jgi:hypothetical protein